MFKKNFFKILVCIIISAILSCLLQYKKSKVIDYYVIINIEIALFSVSLTIVALLITILDKYKEKITNQHDWVMNSTAILKEICENTVALLFIIILLALASILEPAIVLIPKIDIMTIVLLFSFIVSLLAIFDTTISVYKLVINLKDVLASSANEELVLTQKEVHIIEAYRFLDDEHKKNFENLLRAIATNQQTDTMKQHEEK